MSAPVAGVCALTGLAVLAAVLLAERYAWPRVVEWLVIGGATLLGAGFGYVVATAGLVGVYKRPRIAYTCIHARDEAARPRPYRSDRPRRRSGESGGRIAG